MERTGNWVSGIASGIASGLPWGLRRIVYWVSRPISKPIREPIRAASSGVWCALGSEPSGGGCLLRSKLVIDEDERVLAHDFSNAVLHLLCFCSSLCIADEATTSVGEGGDIAATHDDATVFTGCIPAGCL